jgi:hypothetical protein
MSEPTKNTFHFNFNSDNSIKNGDSHLYQLNDIISLAGKTCMISVLNFQGLNAIHNVTKNNQTFLEEILPVGFYSIKQITSFLRSVLLESASEKTVVCNFNENTLFFEFKNFEPFLLYGSMLSFLNIKEPQSVLKNGLYTIESESPVDLFIAAHNIHMMCENIKINNPLIENDSFYTQDRVAKITIMCNWSQYIFYENTTAQRMQIFENHIKDFNILLLNDLGEPIFSSVKYSFTLVLEIYEHPDQNEIFLNKIDPPVKNSFNAHYPVVKQATSKLKNGRELREEDFMMRKKSYLSTHPYYNFSDEEVEDILKKYKKLKKKIVLQ